MNDKNGPAVDPQTAARAQRDRFMAFAFAAANVLLEIEKDGTITYCEGTTQSLFGKAPKQLVGLNIVDLVPGEETVVVREFINRILQQAKVEGVYMRFLGAKDQFAHVLASGIALPHAENKLHLTLTRARAGLGGAAMTSREPLKKEDFIQLAQERIKEGKQFGDNYNMTLVDLSSAGIDDRIEPDAALKMMANVEAYLQAYSVGGNSVGRLGDKQFGIIHDQSVASPAIEQHIGEIAGQFDPQGEPIKIQASTMAMDTAALSPDDISKALVYTINRFVAEGGENFSVKSLADSYQTAMNETLTQVNQFRSALASDDFTFFYQPIVGLIDYRIHHYEALARMKQDGKYVVPAKFITFAEELGVINELDLLATRKAIAVLKKGNPKVKHLSIAVNLSGRSLSSPGFITQFMSELVTNRDALKGMMFEITESAEVKNLEEANNIVQKIRALGCPVCLDDFGAGAAAFQYLKAFQIDYVKIDGHYILEAFNSSYGRPFLKAIANLCGELQMQTIGEMIEDERTVKLLRELHVGFGQGYFFGRPALEPSDLQLPEGGGGQKRQFRAWT